MLKSIFTPSCHHFDCLIRRDTHDRFMPMNASHLDQLLNSLQPTEEVKA
jgi:hypothetical protein